MRFKNISTGGLLVDWMPNSSNPYHNNCIAESEGNYKQYWRGFGIEGEEKELIPQHLQWWFTYIQQISKTKHMKYSTKEI